MPKPIEFPGMNVLFGAKQDEYAAMPAFRAKTPQVHVVTCWQFTPEEIEKLKANDGKLWLTNLTFNRPLMPIIMSVEPAIEVMTDEEVEAERQAQEKRMQVAGKNAVIVIAREGHADLMFEVPVADVDACTDENHGITVGAPQNVEQQKDGAKDGDLKLRLVRSAPDMPFAVQYAAQYNIVEDRFVGCPEKFKGAQVTVKPPLGANLRLEEQEVKFSEWLQQTEAHANAHPEAQLVDNFKNMGATDESRTYWFANYYVKGKTPVETVEEYLTTLKTK